MRMRKGSIANRFFVSLTAIALSIFLLSGIGIFVARSMSYRESQRNRIKDIAAVAETSLSIAIWQYNQPVVDRILNGIFIDPTVLYAEVITDSGRTLAREFRNPEEGTVYSDYKLRHGRFPIELPIHWEDEEIGQLRLVLADPTFHARLFHEIEVMLLVVVCILIVSYLVISRSLRTHLLNPLHELMDSSHLLAGGQLEKPVVMNRNDEIGELAADFDRMRESLYNLVTGLRSANRLKDAFLLGSAVNVPMQRLCEAALEHTGSALGMIVLNGEGGPTLEVRCHPRGFCENHSSRSIDDLPEESNQLIRSVISLTQPLSRVMSPTPGSEPVHMLGIPVLNAWEKKVIAVIYLESPEEVSRERQELVLLIAGQVGIAIENALLIENLELNVRTRTQELEASNTNLRTTIDELRRAQAEIVRLERKNTAIAMAVTANHEINQPLMALQGSFELLETTLGDPTADQTRQLGRIRTALDRIRGILEKLAELRDVHLADYTEGTVMAVWDDQNPERPEEDS